MSTDIKPNTETNPDDVLKETPKTKEEIISERVAEAHRESSGSVQNSDATGQEGGSEDVSTQKVDSSDASKDADILKFIESSTGRKFDSIEAFKKNYENLNSLVGDQEVAKARKAAETLAAWEQKFGKPAPEIGQMLADLAVTLETSKDNKSVPVVGETKSEVVKQEVKSREVPKELDSRLEKLEHATKLAELEKRYPEAIFLADEISTLAKQEDISYVEAFEKSPLKHLVELKKKEDSQKSPVVTPSNRTGFNKQKIEDLGKKVMSRQHTEEDAEALVTELLGL